MNVPKIEIAVPTVGEEELQALRGPLTDGWLTQGPRVAEFESIFAKRHNVDHAIAVTSCTTGLHLTLVALGVGPGDEVIVPAFTWVATANVVVQCGALPVFVDVDPATFNIEPALIAQALTIRTKAIIPVHLFGLCADMETIRPLIPDNVAIVEDAACAVGADFKGRPAGNLGTAGVFSFHPRKIITTGEGGMITTSEEELAETLRRLRNHGARVSEEERHRGSRPWILPDFDDCGFNYRMTDLQGAVGIAQMNRLDGLLKERRSRAEWYREQISRIEWLRAPNDDVDVSGHSWQSYVTTVTDSISMGRDDVMEKLNAAGISARPGTQAVPDLGWYRKNLGTSMDCFPGAAQSASRTMAVPLHNQMNDSDFERVISVLGSL